MQIQELTSYLDEYLSVSEIPDYPGAWNGLQVESEREIRVIATAVDATAATIAAAADGGADLLLVHHGLFWDGNPTVTGRRYRRLKRLLAEGMALYSAHLPLDVHEGVGNNAVLARQLGVEVEGHLTEYKGLPMGVTGRLSIRREALAARLDELLGGRIHLVPGGPTQIERVGIITGGAGSEVGTAAAAGLDAFITGEGAHHNYFDAEEGGINLYLGGHYATEVWGVQALGEHLREKFGLGYFFIDRPTGL